MQILLTTISSLFLRFGNCLFFPLFPEDQEHFHTGEAILDVLVHQSTGLSVLFLGLWLSLSWVCTESAAGSDSSPLCSTGVFRAGRGVWGRVRMQEMLGTPCWALPFMLPWLLPSQSLSLSSSQNLNHWSGIFAAAARLSCALIGFVWFYQTNNIFDAGTVIFCLCQPLSQPDPTVPMPACRQHEPSLLNSPPLAHVLFLSLPQTFFDMISG